MLAVKDLNDQLVDGQVLVTGYAGVLDQVANAVRSEVSLVDLRAQRKRRRSRPPICSSHRRIRKTMRRLLHPVVVFNGAPTQKHETAQAELNAVHDANDDLEIPSLKVYLLLKRQPSLDDLNEAEVLTIYLLG
jgi:hypothetical protein